MTSSNFRRQKRKSWADGFVGSTMWLFCAFFSLPRFLFTCWINTVFTALGNYIFYLYREYKGYVPVFIGWPGLPLRWPSPSPSCYSDALISDWAKWLVSRRRQSFRSICQTVRFWTLWFWRATQNVARGLAVYVRPMPRRDRDDRISCQPEIRQRLAIQSVLIYRSAVMASSLSRGENKNFGMFQAK